MSPNADSSRGIDSNIYPQTPYWSIKGSTELIDLTQMSISRITKALTKPSTRRPATEAANDREYGESLPHDLIYSSIGTPLSSDADEKAWLKNIHRKTFHRAIDKKSRYKSCRLKCGCRKESHRHFDECPASAKARKWVIKMITTFNTNPDDVGPKAWAFGLNKNNKLLNMPARAILRIWRRMNYKHLTAHDSKKNRVVFSNDRVIRDIARRLMENLLAYQQYRRNYYYDKRNSDTECHRSTEEVEMFAPIGRLCYDTGILRVNPKTRKALRKQGVWTDFNSHKKSK